MVKSYPTKPLRGTEVEINGNKYNITPGLQKVFTERTYQSANSMNDTIKLFLEISYRKLVIIIVNLQKVVYQIVIDL